MTDVLQEAAGTSVISKPVGQEPNRTARVRANHVVVAGAVVFTAFMCWLLWTLKIDDSYISYRYARHLVHGHRLAWNVGEHPVEGYTNFAWVLLNAIPIAIGRSPLAFSKLVGSAAVIGTGLLLYRSAFRITGQRSSGWLASALWFTYLPVYVHAASGLETVAYSGAWLLAVHLALVRLDDEEDSLVPFALASLLVVLLRIEVRCSSASSRMQSYDARPIGAGH